MAFLTADSHLNLLFPAHPTLERPTIEELAGMRPEKVRELSAIWHDAIRWAELDPLNSGDHPEPWHDALAELDRPDTDGVTVFGGNRGSKTSFGAWVVVQALLKNPGAIIYCWSQTKDTSQLIQQPRIYQMLPPDLRVKKTEDLATMHYKIATGFVNDSFTLPNGSSCRFHYYTQFMLNPNMLEGFEIGWKGRYGEESPFCNVGNWFDEYLIAPTLMRTMEERLSTRNAKSLTTFTPIHQYNEVVEEILEGVETVKEEKTLADDPPQIAGEEVPYIQRKPHRSIIYFATRKNPYHNYARSKRNMEGKPRDWVLMKLYGVPTKVNSSKFPSYDREIHEIEELPKFTTSEDAMDVEYEPTRFHITIPAGDRPWFMIWVAVDKDGNNYIYREWPRYFVEGAFAERRDGAWDWGDACKGDCVGMGRRAYMKLIEELEDGEVIEERIMFEGHSAIADDMADIGVEYGEVADEGEQEGFQAIHDMLEGPSLRILEHCKNVTGAIVGYDVDKARTNKAHPWKGPVDALRLMAQEKLTHDLADQGDWVPPRGGY